MSDSYDDRKRGRDPGRPSRAGEPSARRRSRSRSRSPPAVATAPRKDPEAERKARMARLRAENDQEEEQLTAVLEQKPAKPNASEQIMAVDETELAGLEAEEQMQLLLGFTGGFGSTKNTKVETNHKGAAVGASAKHKARKYRQYMNRKNGFNRPLDKID